MVPIFPLPSTVVFPGMRVPLYVFEARYKRLVRFCLELEEPIFAIALSHPDGVIRDGEAPFFKTGSFVRIIELAESPDGSYTLLGYGEGRCRIRVSEREEVADADGSARTLYYSHEEAWPLVRGDPNLERVAAWDALDAFREYAKTFFAFDALRQIEEAMPDDPIYQASFICANLRVPVESRQVLLEAPSLTARLQLAQKLMLERLQAHRPARG